MRRTRQPITRKQMLTLYSPEAVDLMDFTAWEPSLSDYDSDELQDGEHVWSAYGPPSRWRDA